MRSCAMVTALLVIALVRSPRDPAADTVRLQSGKTVEGMFIGADSRTLRVLLDSGQVSEIPLEQTVGVEFTARKPPQPARRRRRHPQAGRRRRNPRRPPRRLRSRGDRPGRHHDVTFASPRRSTSTPRGRPDVQGHR